MLNLRDNSGSDMIARPKCEDDEQLDLGDIRSCRHKLNEDKGEDSCSIRAGLDSEDGHFCEEGDVKVSGVSEKEPYAGFACEKAGAAVGMILAWCGGRGGKLHST
jgi:hypothetical protein